MLLTSHSRAESSWSASTQHRGGRGTTTGSGSDGIDVGSQNTIDVTVTAEEPDREPNELLQAPGVEAGVHGAHSQSACLHSSQTPAHAGF